MTMEQNLREMLQAHTIAVVGLSDDPTRASYRVSAYMQRAGYKIIPVNPSITQVLGEVSYPSLRDLQEKPDLVNVFRLPRVIPSIVDEMIALDLKQLWTQVGIEHPEAAQRAEQAGIRVVMDRCLMVEHRRLAPLQ